MSVSKRNMPIDYSEDTLGGGKPKSQDSDKVQPKPTAKSEDGLKGPDPVSKEFSNEDSANASANRLRNNANDPTQRDPTRSTDKPIQGKIKP